MTEESHRPSHVGHAGDVPSPDADPSLEALRDILLGRYRQQIAGLEAELDDLERRINDKDALIDTIAPVLGDAIRRKIRDAQEEMVEALYPIIGQLVVRAVSEAIRDLAQTLDAQVRTSFNPRVIWWRLRARIGGASDAEIRLRERLPFQVAEVFLIHRETGLLLWYVSQEPDVSSDSDLISSMLTAIRDFAQDAFGRGKEGQLDEIEYGDRRILIEAAQHAYVAVVIDGVAPPGFRAEMREQIIGIEHAHQEVLHDYDGDPRPLAPVEESLRSLMTASRPAELSPTQKRLLAGTFGLLAILLMGACIVTGWVLRAVRSVPPQVAAAVRLTWTPMSMATSLSSFTATASPSATSTATPSPALTSTPTAMLTPTPAFVMGLMIGNAWPRMGPAVDAPHLGVILERGQQIEVLAVYGDWYRVRWASQAQTGVIGWVPARWVETTISPPAWIVTPTTGP